MYFAADVLWYKGTVDEGWFAPLLAVALFYPERHIRLLVERFGTRRVLAALVAVYEREKDETRQFLTSIAAYYAQPSLEYIGTAAYERREPTEESRAAIDEVADLMRRFAEPIAGTWVIRSR